MGVIVLPYLNLTISPSFTDTTVVSSCDSYLWYNNIYTLTGIYDSVFTDSQGCDSIIVLDLSIYSTGCTDPLALNYDSLALCDDGSCCSSTLFESLLGYYIEGDDNSDLLGWDVSFNASGNIMAISSLHDEISGSSNSGSVSVFEYIGNSWVQLGQTLYGPQQSNEKFGWSISLNDNGDILAVGIKFSGNQQGKVRIYQLSGTNWSQLGQDLDGQNQYDEFGSSVSLNGVGNIIAIGIPMDDNTNGTNSGSVKVYELNAGTWNSFGFPIIGTDDSDLCGSSLELSSDGYTVVIGSHEHHANGVSQTGQARVFNWNGINWIQKGQNLDGVSYGEHFGVSVSINNDGSIIAVGAEYTDNNFNNSGSAKLYDFDGANWNQIGQDINGIAFEAYLGTSISLNGSGSRVAIGARYNDQSGYAVIYQNVNNLWVETSYIAGVNHTGAFFGNSVSLNNIGDKIAIGAPFFDGSTQDGGLVAAYSVSTPCSGCTDSTGFNYDPFAILDDSSCALPIYGCIDSLSFNYDSLAQVDDGSCLPFIYGCVNLTALNYDSLANTDDGSCIIEGCMNDTAINYNPLATVSDSSCVFFIYGCTDNTYSNYNSLATMDDGSCCNDPINPWQQIGSDFIGSGWGGIGYSMSLNMNGDIMAVGTYSSGVVKIYQKSGSNWSQLGSDLVGSSYFGTSVSLDSIGHRLAIGDRTNTGEVFIYDYNSATNSWNLVGSQITGSVWNGGFGRAVSLSNDGNTVAISTTNTTKVQVYSWLFGFWQQLGGDIAGSNNDFGEYLSLNGSGNRIIISDRGNGQSLVFEFISGSWTQLGQALYDNPNGSEVTVSISNDGNIVAMGSPSGGQHGNSTSYVNCFKWDGTIWNQIGQTLNSTGNGDRFGHKVSLVRNGNRLAISAPNNNNSGFTDVGEVRVYDLDTVLASWILSAPPLYAGAGNGCCANAGSGLSINENGDVFSIGIPNYQVME